MARAVAFPTAAASVRIPFIAASGANGMSFPDTDGCKQAAYFRVNGIKRLLLDYLVDLIEERMIIGRNTIEILPGHIHKIHLRGICRLRQRVNPKVLFHILYGGC